MIMGERARIRESPFSGFGDENVESVWRAKSAGKYLPRRSIDDGKPGALHPSTHISASRKKEPVSLLRGFVRDELSYTAKYG